MHIFIGVMFHSNSNYIIIFTQMFSKSNIAARIYWSQYACINTRIGGCVKKRRFYANDWKQYRQIYRQKHGDYSNVERQYHNLSRNQFFGLVHRQCFWVIQLQPC